MDRLLKIARALKGYIEKHMGQYENGSLYIATQPLGKFVIKERVGFQRGLETITGCPVELTEDHWEMTFAELVGSLNTLKRRNQAKAIL